MQGGGGMQVGGSMGLSPGRGLSIMGGQMSNVSTQEVLMRGNAMLGGLGGAIMGGSAGAGMAIGMGGVRQVARTSPGQSFLGQY